MARPTGQPPRNVLLVEGVDDKHVALHIWGRLAADPPFCAVEKDTVEKLLASISREVRVPGREAVGILVDANTKPAGRWAAVKDRLAQVNITLHGSPVPGGAIIDSRPRVGVWLMPDNASDGELEDFVIEMIPDGDAVWPLAQAYIDGIPRGERKFIPKKQPRAEVHAWLAAREDPRLMGAAIGARDLDVDGALCREFAAWLNALFT